MSVPFLIASSADVNVRAVPIGIPGCGTPRCSPLFRSYYDMPWRSAVDDHQFTIGFDGCLSASHAYRDVAVDDVAVLPRDTERIENHVADFLVVPQSVVVPFLFGMGGFVLQEIAFEVVILDLSNRGESTPHHRYQK